MQKPERSLKIYSHHRSADNKEVPELRLIGGWMEQLGFKAGERVNIIARDGLLIIQVTK